MFHIDFESKRFKNGLRFFTYGVMTTAVIVITSLIILLALGYRFDRQELSVVRQGLVQLASHPESMQYSINDGQITGSTPARLNLNAGDYTVRMEKEGYRPWQRNLTVMPGIVHWINYPRLIPQELTTEDVEQFEDIAFAKAAPDKRWVLLGQKQPANITELRLLDVANPDDIENQRLALPESQLTKRDGNLGQLDFVEWSLNSNYFLVRHRNGDINEYLRVDRTKSEEAINLNRLFELSIDEAHFSGGNNNILFARTGDVLRRFNVADNVVSGALMTGVRQFEIYGDDTITFTRVSQNDKSQQEVGIRYGNDDDIILERFNQGDQITVAYSEFDNHQYFVLANASERQAFIFRDPKSAEGKNHFIEFTDLAPEFVRFSGNSRFVVLQEGSNFGVYDFYDEQQFTYRLTDQVQPGHVAKWIDDFHLTLSINGKLHFWDFDGNNIQELMDANSNFDPVMDESDDIIYAFTNRGNDATLTSTSIVVE